jgi:cell division septation protein DedD
VALCAVFFAFGYWIGHNTSKPVTSGAENAAAPSAQETEPPRETAASSEPQSPTPTLADAQAPAADPTLTPAATEPVATKTRAAQDTPAGTAVNPVVPQPGATYLQVTALRRDDAEKLVRTLKEQRFPALVADSSKPDLVRVLVGPYHQTADVADAKTKLKELGFGNAFVQK